MHRPVVHLPVMHAVHPVVMPLHPGAELDMAIGGQGRFEAMLRVANDGPQRVRALLDDRENLRVQAVEKRPAGGGRPVA